MSLPYGLDLNNQINIDKSATRFTVTLDNISAGEVRGLVEAGEAWLQNNTPPAMQSVGTTATQRSAAPGTMLIAGCSVKGWKL